MEITVTDADESVPAHTYISVRYGDQRRQAPFRKGQTFSFTKSAEKSYTVDVFRKVASKQMSVAGISALGGTLKSEKVELSSLEIQGSPINVSLSASVSSDAKPGDEGPKSALKKEEAAMRMKKYLEKHDVQSIMQDMFAQLVESLPSDPLLFCVDYLEQRRWDADPDHQERCFEEEPGLGDTPLPGFMAGDPLPDLRRHHSLVADALRSDVDLYPRLRSQVTALGVSVAECIKPGIDCPGHELMKVSGLFAGDAECYDLFAVLFKPVIKTLHTGCSVDSDTEMHPSDTAASKLSNMRIDPLGHYAVHSLLEVRRNLSGLRFPSCCSKDERREVERLLTQAMGQLQQDLQGVYLPLATSRSHAAKVGGMAKHQEARLRKAGMLFAEPDSRMRLSAGFGRHWPDARGIFVSDTQAMYMWCNEEDHLRCFTRQQDGDVKAMWSRVERTLASVEATLAKSGHSGGFARHDRLGYLTTCPSRLGTAIRATVALKIPHCAAKLDLPLLCRAHGLQPSQEVSSAAHGSVWNISNLDILGVSEVDLLNTLIEGCAALVAAEQRLERGELVFDIMPGLGDSPMPGFPETACPSKMPDLSVHKSIAARRLCASPSLWSELRTKKTPLGVGFAACVKPGIDDPKTSSSGLVAGDADAYAAYADLFNLVINDLHRCGPGSGQAFEQPVDVNTAKLSNTDMDPSGTHIKTVRVELRRNLEGLRFSPCCSAEERLEVERRVVAAGQALSISGSSFPGVYVPLAGSGSCVPPEGVDVQGERQQLASEGLIFGEPMQPFQLSAGVGRHWPSARGVFRTDRRDCVLWCNEEDHVRAIAQRRGRDVKEAFGTVIGFADALNKELEKAGTRFSHASNLGFLTVRPEMIGCGMVFEVTLSIPRMSARGDFGGICENLDLSWSLRGSSCVVSNISAYGVSEVDLANSMIEGCATLVSLEESLERGRAIEGELQQLGLRR
mmetsp:Transcript_43793/g.103517  ORF Transcript_43793/g.103517 Transcript_43793/m.103517 type:complete len:959 (-) Transcript_43793:241-3117(-)